MTGNEEDAKDVLQESLFRAYRSLGQFEQRADLGTWLHRIVANCAVDFMRASRSRPDRRPQAIADVASMIASPAPTPERLAASAEAGRQIAAALENLKPVERASFTLRHFEGWSIDEIAQGLGLGQSATKQHVFRAIRKLRRVLEGEGSGR